MAKKRKKNHIPKIKKWTSRHTNVVNTLARFALITVENLKKATTVINANVWECFFGYGWFRIYKNR